MTRLTVSATGKPEAAVGRRVAMAAERLGSISRDATLRSTVGRARALKRRISDAIWRQLQVDLGRH
jgi:hypothetical protein